MTHSPVSVAVGGSLGYTITVTNNGPANVTSIPVSSSFSAYLTNISCTKSGGSPCSLDASGNIQDIVNLANGASITYTVNATVIQSANGNIVSTASVNVTDTNPANNSTTDTSTLVIGSMPDGSIYNVLANSYLTLNLTLTTGPGWDVVYYERPNGTGILLDWMIVEVSTDGTNWSRVFYWGDEQPDTNTNVDFTNLPGYPQTPEEPDQRDISSTVLYNSTGIAIDLDSLGLSGTYYYIRFYAPSGDIDGHSEIDAIQVLH